MADDYEDFINKRNQGRSDEEILANDVWAEWGILMGFVSQFAIDHREVDGHPYEWSPEPRGGLLVLGYASALLSRPNPNPVIVPKSVLFTVYINRRPAGPGKVYAEDEPPIPRETWTLEPSVKRGEFLWEVHETGWKGSTKALADEIAKAVVNYYDAYKKKFPLAM
jgi:hypothetical protein